MASKRMIERLASRRKKSSRLGFVLWRGLSPFDQSPIVAIATLESVNGKTGDMVQVWILPDGRMPLETLRENDNGGICGDCPLQGVYDPGKKGNGGKQGGMVGRGCYVQVYQAPTTITNAYNRGSYPDFVRSRDEEVLSGRKIRLGAYGDPAMMPIDLVEYLVKISTGHTGYSHQLLGMKDRELANRYAQVLMVSCHNVAQHEEAGRRGWRAFTIVAEKHASEERFPTDAVECPFYTHGVQCDTCLLCSGSAKQAKSVYAIAHSRSGVNILPLQQIGFAKRKATTR